MSPFIKLPSEEQIIAATLPIYSGMPMASFGTASFYHMGPEKSVLMRPGDKPLTLIPSTLSSSFIHFTMFSNAALVLPYTPMVQLGY